MTDHEGKLTLWGVEVFLAAAEEGSVSSAARKLGTSPSSVSQQITSLESALGVELLNRRERPMTLTTKGGVFRRRAQSIMIEAARARSELAAFDLAHLPRLSVGIVEDFDDAVTPQLMSAMAQRLSETRLSLNSGASHRMIDRLEHRELDMAVAMELGDLTDWCHAIPILKDPFVMLRPRSNAREAVPFIRYTRRHAIGRLIDNHMVSEGMQAQGRFELDSYRAILAMVAQGQGWTILPALGVLSLLDGAHDIAVEPLPVAPLSRRISLLSRRDGVNEMADIFATELRNLVSRLAVEPLVAKESWLAPDFKVLS